MSRFDELVEEVISISKSWGLYEQSDERAQQVKAFEEYLEFLDADIIEDQLMEVGDIAVCIINANWFHNDCDIDLYWKRVPPPITSVLSDIAEGSYHTALGALDCFTKWYTDYDYGIIDCLELAVKKIRERDGMMINKRFVKYDDLTDEQKVECDRRKKNA